MTDMTQSPTAQGPESTPHAYDAPGLTPRDFLRAVMCDRQLPLSDRMEAASRLLYLYPHDWDPPRLRYHIGGIPHCHSLSTDSGPGAGMERTEFNSHFSAFAQKGPTYSGDKPGTLNIETIIEDIRSGNFPTPTLCTRCGHYMPYPCTKAPLN
jgi:hypothetical protein